LGYKTPEGEVFLMQDYLDLIARNLSNRKFDSSQRSVDQAFDYADSVVGYPCYAKPNFGSQGRGVTRCENPDDLERTINEFQSQGSKMFLLEQAVDMPDFRVVVFGDEVISCYQRVPLHVVGNGRLTIEQLLRQKQSAYFEQGREEKIDMQDPGMLARLERYKLTTQSVLTPGQEFQILDVSNLSKGGESEEFTDKIHEAWKKLSIAITKDMGLRLCGVDLACTDLKDPNSDYSILEINAAPGLDNYAFSGDEQFKKVKELYIKVFNELGQV
jgi:D-alanine-D-alanine ligase-like ATP-grasp enzyme